MDALKTIERNLVAARTELAIESQKEAMVWKKIAQARQKRGKIAFAIKIAGKNIEYWRESAAANRAIAQSKEEAALKNEEAALSKEREWREAETRRETIETRIATLHNTIARLTAAIAREEEVVAAMKEHVVMLQGEIESITKHQVISAISQQDIAITMGKTAWAQQEAERTMQGKVEIMENMRANLRMIIRLQENRRNEDEAARGAEIQSAENAANWAAFYNAEAAASRAEARREEEAALRSEERVKRITNLQKMAESKQEEAKKIITNLQIIANLQQEKAAKIIAELQREKLLKIGKAINKISEVLEARVVVVMRKEAARFALAIQKFIRNRFSQPNPTEAREKPAIPAESFSRKE